MRFRLTFRSRRRPEGPPPRRETADQAARRMRRGHAKSQATKRLQAALREIG